MQGGLGFLIQSAWPTYDNALTVDITATMAVQVDGKVRGTLVLARDASEEDARAAALTIANVVKKQKRRAVAKLIFLPGRILGFVTKPA